MKVILGFPSTGGYPVDFEAVPDVGEEIDWPAGSGREDLAPPAKYIVKKRHFVFNQLTGLMTPYLTLEFPPDGGAGWSL